MAAPVHDVAQCTLAPGLVVPVVLSALLSCGCGPAEPPEAVEAALELDRPARRLIQQGLRSEGFDPGAADGLFGARTRAAIRRWQASRAASATGFLDGSEAEVLRVAGVSRRGAGGEVLTSASSETEPPADVARAADGVAEATGEPAPSAVVAAAPEPSGDFIGWVRAVDASMTDAERAVGAAEAAAAATGGWFSRTAACLAAEERMASALDRVAQLTAGEARPETVAPAAAEEVPCRARRAHGGGARTGSRGVRVYRASALKAWLVRR